MNTRKALFNIERKKMKFCQICQKGPQKSYNRPHSLHRTKRTIKPNIQKIHGKLICVSCLRTLTRKMSFPKQGI